MWCHKRKPNPVQHETDRAFLVFEIWALFTLLMDGFITLQSAISY